MTTKEVMAQGGIEKLGLPDSFLKFTLADGSKKIIEKNMPEHTVGVELILEVLTNAEYGCIKSLEEIDAVGHRLVHGGEKFNTSVVITPEVIKQMEACTELAPLHNPANLLGMKAVTVREHIAKVGKGRDHLGRHALLPLACLKAVDGGLAHDREQVSLQAIGARGGNGIP